MMHDQQDQNLSDDRLTERVIGLCFQLHNELGGGFLESVYEAGMAVLLDESAIPYRRQVAVPVRYHGKLLGNFRADLLIADQLLVELKACEGLSKIHQVQLVNYLKATSIDLGLLINFGPTKVDIRRKVRQLPHHPVNPAHPVIPSNLKRRDA